MATGFLEVDLIVSEYQRVQAEMTQAFARLKEPGSGLATQITAGVGLDALAKVMLMSPVLTGTLKAAQRVFMYSQEEHEAEAIVSTSRGLKNPLLGGDPADYVFEVVQRKDFYEWAMAQMDFSQLDAQAQIAITALFEEFSV